MTMPLSVLDTAHRTSPAAWRAAPGNDRAGGKEPGASSGQPGERLLGKRVLIVEDEALLALELQFAFEDEGADVIGPALSLETALGFVTQGEEIDYAVLDVDIAGKDVYPVVALLQRHGVPILFHTGHGSCSELAAMFPGAITCIKPALPGALVMQLLKLGR